MICDNAIAFGKIIVTKVATIRRDYERQYFGDIKKFKFYGI